MLKVDKEMAEQIVSVLLQEQIEIVSCTKHDDTKYHLIGKSKNGITVNWQYWTTLNVPVCFVSVIYNDDIYNIDILYKETSTKYSASKWNSRFDYLTEISKEVIENGKFS